MGRWAAPEGLEAGGLRLWAAVSESHELDVAQMVTLAEACRAKDRLDELDEILRGDVDTWVRLVHRPRSGDYVLLVDDVARLANATADNLKKLLSALRLPDGRTGRRPQRRGPRGVQKPSKVSSLVGARARGGRKRSI